MQENVSVEFSSHRSSRPDVDSYPEHGFKWTILLLLRSL